VDDLDALPPQQSAALAAALALGASNREVAAELFLAPNTVEFHLPQINHKLAATLAREAAPEPPADLGP
jgi:LuxR family transcriptional regulator, maltose regulon positive regulatory protein